MKKKLYKLFHFWHDEMVNNAITPEEKELFIKGKDLMKLAWDSHKELIDKGNELWREQIEARSEQFCRRVCEDNKKLKAEIIELQEIIKGKIT